MAVVFLLHRSRPLLRTQDLHLSARYHLRRAGSQYPRSSHPQVRQLPPAIPAKHYKRTGADPQDRLRVRDLDVPVQHLCLHRRRKGHDLGDRADQLRGLAQRPQFQDQVGHPLALDQQAQAQESAGRWQQAPHHHPRLRRDAKLPDRWPHLWRGGGVEQPLDQEVAAPLQDQHLAHQGSAQAQGAKNTSIK